MILHNHKIWKMILHNTISLRLKLFKVSAFDVFKFAVNFVCN